MQLQQLPQEYRIGLMLIGVGYVVWLYRFLRSRMPSGTVYMGEKFIIIYGSIAAILFLSLGANSVGKLRNL